MSTSDNEDYVPSSVETCKSDVYDLAGEIATEFENIVPLCGCDIIVPVVHKVIHALELLENVVGVAEVTTNDVFQLRNQIRDMKAKYAVDADIKMKLEQDLANVEDSWIKETQELKDNLSCLKDDNKHLQKMLDDHLEQKPDDGPSDHQLIQELENKIATLNHRLAEKEFTLEKKESHISMLNQSIKEQKKVNQKLHVCIHNNQKSIESFLHEKEQLNQKLMQQEEILQLFQQRKSSYSLNISATAEKDADLLEQKQLLLKIEELEHKLSVDNNRELKNNYPISSVDENSTKRGSISQLFHFVLGIVSGHAHTFRGH